MKDKRAQESFSLPFTWIFAILLIIIFVFIAVKAILGFINTGNCSRIGLSMDNLQKKVDEAYQSSSSDFEISLDLPGVKEICFANFSAPIVGSSSEYEQINIYDTKDANAFLVPPGKSCNMPYKKINHLDLIKTTQTKNPYCLNVSEGNTLRIVKDFYDKAVAIR